MGIIDDTKMLEEIKRDLVETYELTPEQAEKVAEQSGADVVSRMWDAYSGELWNLVNEFKASPDYEEPEEES